MSALTRYPVPRAVAARVVDDPRLVFSLEPVDPLTFLRPLRVIEQSIKAGIVEKPRLYFRLEPRDPSAFLRPLRALEAIAVDRVDDLRPSRGVIPGTVPAPTVPSVGIYIPIFRPRRRH